MTNYIKTNYLPILISILSVAVFTGAVGAHQALSDNRSKRAEIYSSIKALRQLDLSEDQKNQIKAQFQQRKENSLDTLNQRKEVLSLIEAGDVDSAAEIAATRARTRVANIAEKKIALEAILSPEQLDQLNALIAERQIKRQEWAEKRAAKRAARAKTATN
ncbi:MAG: hypothetical protein KTR16_04565 [Acidiferrobacterales bacterium]|nr:hypothetical protein [Acidiferrobacterales bacterium]